MNKVELMISDDQLDVLKQLFKNEPNFQPQTKEDYVLIDIIRSIVEHAKPL